MSIFKDTFRQYVRDQLSLREEIINIGNKPDNGARANRNLVNEITLHEGNTFGQEKNITLDPGAFYNYTLNRQCILRLTSMVDYVENVNLEIGDLEGEQSFNALRGSALSQNFILEGGVLSDFSRVKNGQKITRRVTTPRDSFPRKGQKSNLGYGDPAIGADASSDGYGIVPMPGIIDATIRTKSAYGSLREAKVTFECHNRRQLEVLEMLYMRPGYMAILEWGWTPYITNNGELYTSTRLLEDYFSDTDGKNSRIYTNNLTQEEVFSAINKLKEFHNGNYDGFLGFVKNFGFQARDDGGFSCYTELISIGEVIDSIKMPNLSTVDGSASNIFVESQGNSASNISITSQRYTGGESSYVEQKVDQAVFDRALDAGIFPRYNGLNGLVKSLSNYAHFNNFTQYSISYNTTTDEEQNLSKIFDFENEETYKASPTEEQNRLRNQRSTATQIAKDAGYGDFNGQGRNNFLRDLVKFQTANLENYLKTVLQISPEDGNGLLNYIIPVGGRKTGGEYQNPQPFIRWDAFCALINENLITKDEKGNRPIKIVSDRLYDTDIPERGITKIDPLLHVPIGDYTNTQNNTIIDFSCDANVCILPIQFETNTLESRGGTIDSLAIEDSLGYIPQINKFPVDYIIATYNKGLPVYYKDSEITPQKPTLLTPTDRARRIGSIFLNINMLNNIAEKNSDNDNYTIGKFLNDIWGEVNKVCPNHNFVVTDDKESNVVFVIDLPVDNSEVPSDLHEFIPFSNKNILRNFEYTSNVPSSLSATVAIQAQDPRSIQDIDGVTFAAFNRSIKNRLLSTDTTSNWQKTKNTVTQTANTYEEKQNKLAVQINRYYSSFFRNLKLTANDKDILGEGNITNILKEYQKNAAYLSNAFSKTSVFNSVIPLEFSATLDGIAGIVIGNMFKVRKDRLPKAYANANIGFIVFGEEQKITAGQDWTTDISGKMTILPEEGKKPIINGIVTSTFTDEKILNVESQISEGSETEKLPEGQAAVTDISQATDGDAVYLKKIKDNTIETIDGEEITDSIGVTFVRSTPTVNNEGWSDWGDNVIGAFNSWENGGELLGTIKPDGVRAIPFSGGFKAILPSSYNTYFETAPQKRYKFLASKKEIIKKDGQEIECYGVTYQSLLNRNPGIKIKDFKTGEFPPLNDSIVWIRVSDVTETEYVWYNISFTKEASDIFLNGWVRDRNNIKTEGADEQLYATVGNSASKNLNSFSAANDCWMRFDTLAASAESAIQAFIENDEPEIVSEPPILVLAETYRGIEIYKQDPGDLAAFDSEGNPTTNPPTFEVAEDVLFNEQVAIAAGESFLNIEEIKSIIDQINL